MDFIFIDKYVNKIGSKIIKHFEDRTIIDTSKEDINLHFLHELSLGKTRYARFPLCPKMAFLYNFSTFFFQT